MSGFITAEGLVIPVGSDYYDYTGDQKRLSSSIRSIVPVATQAAANTVVTNMATDGRTVSDSNPLITWQADVQSIMVKGSGSAWVPADGKYMRHAEYTSASVTSGAGGAGVNFGTWTATSDSTTQNNTFSQAGASAGQIKILEAGVYAVYLSYQPNADPGTLDLNIGLSGSRGEALGIFERIGGKYGDLFSAASHPGLYLAVNDILAPLVACSNANITFGGRFYITKLQG